MPWAYSGVKNFRENQRFKPMSVTGHVSRDFPPSFIRRQRRLACAQAIAFARILGGLGIHVDTLFFAPDRIPPLPHEYQFNLDEPAGREARNRMLALLGGIRDRAISGSSRHPEAV